MFYHCGSVRILRTFVMCRPHGRLLAIAVAVPWLLVAAGCGHGKKPSASPVSSSSSPTPVGTAAPTPIVEHASTAVVAPSVGSILSPASSSTASPSEASSSTPTLTDVSLSPSVVGEGQTITASITLSGPAPAGGLPITLTTRDFVGHEETTNGAIPAGKSYVSTSVTASVYGVFSMTLVSGSVTKSASVRIVALEGLTLIPARVYPGGSYTLTARLTSAAPLGGASVALTQNGNSESPIIIPEGETSGTASYTAGSAGSNTFVATYGTISYQVVQTTLGSYADAAPDIPSCSGPPGDDDAPCTDAEGNTITFGAYRGKEQDYQDLMNRRQEQVREETSGQ